MKYQMELLYVFLAIARHQLGDAIKNLFMPNSKRKGNAGEHAFSKWMVSNGLKCHRNAMSGGSIWKGDIGNDLNLAIEVKTVKKLNLQEAWRQVIRDSKLSH